MIKQIAWISIIPQVLILGLIILIWYQFNQTEFILFGAITFILLSLLLRNIIAREHRKGITKVKSEEYNEAINHFKNSYTFFSDHQWIDCYRYMTMLSSGTMCYPEMALNNIAFCYGQLGNGKLSKEYYEKLLVEYPENRIAKSALKLLDSGRKMEE